MSSIKILAPIFLTFLCVTSQVLALDISDNGGSENEAVSPTPATTPASLNTDTTGHPPDETKDEATTVKIEDTITQNNTEASTTTTPSSETTTQSSETTTQSSGNQPSLTFPVIFVLALSYFCLH